jgi:hypothetical protein
MVSQSCVTMSEGEKSHLEIANFAKENSGCCIEKGYAGVNVILNRKNEIEITDVDADSPAGKAGVLPGDIILKIDDEDIQDKYKAFVIYDSKYPGDKTSLIIKRKGEIITKQFQLISHHFLNVYYTLIELVYKNTSVRLAVIPGKLNFEYPGLKEFYEKLESHYIGRLESGFIRLYRNQNNFALIDRQKTDSILNELKFQESGLVDNKSRTKLGTMLGATHLMIKDISSYIPNDNKPEFLYTLRLIEVESGKNLATSTFRIKNEETVDIVKIDFIDYCRKIFQTVSLEKEVIDAYSRLKATNNDTLFYQGLANVVIPKYEVLLQKIVNISPVTWEVKNLHQLYIEGTNLKLQAIQLYKSAINQKDEILMSRGNEKMNMGKQKLIVWNVRITDLLNKYNIKP